MSYALLLKAPYGVGKNYLPNNDIFFCPSDFVRAPNRNPVNGWGPASLTNTRAASMSYWKWNYPETYWTRNVGGPPIFAKSDPALVNDRFSRKNGAMRAVLTDQGQPVYPWTTAAEAALTRDNPPFHKKGVNVLYLDGHVNFVEDSAIANMSKPIAQGGRGYSRDASMIRGYNTIGR